MTNPNFDPLVADDWQPDFMADMRNVIDYVADGNLYPGYPRLYDRLYIPEEDILYTPGRRPILPYDPYSHYTLHDHSGDKDITKRRPQAAFYDDGQSLSWYDGMCLQWPEEPKEGGRLDNRNFPLHPYWKEMLTDREIGGIISPGYYRELGPNPTADLAALALQQTEAGLSLHVLTVVRSDNGQHALPGGHLNEGEVGIAGALRETLEETGIDLSHLSPTVVWEGPVADPRVTLHAGPRTTLALLDVPELPKTIPHGQDDAEHAEWRVLNREWVDNAFGSHGSLGKLAVRKWQQLHHVVVLGNGLVVPDPF